MIEVDDTIVAIGSSTMPAARGAVRLTGGDSVAIARALGITPQHDRSAHSVRATIDLGDPLGAVPVLALIWPTSRSYTGQPSLELHTFGSLPILKTIVDRTLGAGARAARPGEFTLRAFLAGRLDLTQAEAVLGVIEAEERGALDHALRQLAGNLSRPLEHARSQLLDLLADVEAGLDFVDEDIQFIRDEDLIDRLSAIGSGITATRKQLAERSRDRSEWIVALRGFPNAGKSRLLNALVGSEAAIVADVAGTTRDVVAVETTIGRHNVLFVDTAGIESTEEVTPVGQISRQAQEHASRAGRDADLRLWCVDFAEPAWQNDAEQLTEAAAEKRRAAGDIWVATKCDSRPDPPPSPWTPTSAMNGEGIESLKRLIADAIDAMDKNESDSVIGTAARCSGSLGAAETAIESAIRYTVQGDGHEYVSSELRLAAAALGEVTGAVYTDDILDRVFSRFCIGK